jgi:hypothetical protein
MNNNELGELLSNHLNPPQEIIRTIIGTTAVITNYSERSIVPYTTRLYIGSFVTKEVLSESLKEALDNHLKYQTQIFEEFTKSIMELTKK